MQHFRVRTMRFLFGNATRSNVSMRYFQMKNTWSQEVPGMVLSSINTPVKDS